MAKILVTGMSGTGKSTVLKLLATRGHRTVDTDTDQWSHWTTLPNGDRDWIWREPAIAELLADHHTGHLFVSGCKTNQGSFYPARNEPREDGPAFDQIVLLSAPPEVLLTRITERTSNPYGKRPEERAAILANLSAVEPRLRATATAEIDATAPLESIADQLEKLAAPPDQTTSWRDRAISDVRRAPPSDPPAGTAHTG